MISHLDNPNIRLLLVSIMVKRLGGTVTITQEDINEVAYNQLIEKVSNDGSLTFTYVEHPRQG